MFCIFLSVLTLIHLPDTASGSARILVSTGGKEERRGGGLWIKKVSRESERDTMRQARPAHTG